MMKKILITGVFASGKSSLIELLKESLDALGKKVLIYKEVARECPFDLNYNQNIISTSWLIMSQIENEMKISDEHYDYVIYDRGLPDIISHMKFVLTDKKEDLLFYNKLEDLGITSLNNFNYVFLSLRSNNLKILVDDMRVDNDDYQKSLEKIHINYLDRVQSNYIELKEKNMDRLEQILSIIL